ncbi:hypothetical protein FGO68_gene17519 [Halteria grandinella]|uniref:Uncharacterized protein n=1 Tax=Halteria grandinella TaxID=5974 RepID=A0A8J8P695_HALGN|nr:hypothetical protein FGO68_gene17519 [Halteria grandinella]
MRTYFPILEKPNYIISDNQPIWSSSWNVTSYAANLQQMKDPSMKTLVQKFEVQYEFRDKHSKIAYYYWNMTKQQFTHSSHHVIVQLSCRISQFSLKTSRDQAKQQRTTPLASCLSPFILRKELRKFRVNS